jgi:hypothetical protein
MGFVHLSTAFEVPSRAGAEIFRRSGGSCADFPLVWLRAKKSLEKEAKMKKAILATFSAIGLTVILVATTQAQTLKLAADIPFNFNVGNVAMDSGKYTVKIVGDGVLVIQSEDSSRKVAMTFSNAMTPPRNLRNNGRIVFNLYGNQYFLSSVSWPTGQSRSLPPSNTEVLAAKSQENQRRVAIATQ